jgi:hypothetical protein
VANLGAHEQPREPECFGLLAEIVSYFDLVALQEVRDDVDAGVRQILSRLPDSWRLLFSETGGNDERMAFLWDSDKVDQGQLIGKVTIEPADLVHAGGEDFLGFSRTPYVGTPIATNWQWSWSACTASMAQPATPPTWRDAWPKPEP